MKNKKFVIIGLIVILIVAVVSVFAMGHTNLWYGHNDKKKCGECANKNFEYKSDWLERMGLPSDSTYAQIISAKKENWMQDSADYMVNIREKLGLPDDASEGEVQEALQEWKEENNFHYGFGFHTGSFCGQS